MKHRRSLQRRSLPHVLALLITACMLVGFSVTGPFVSVGASAAPLAAAVVPPTGPITIPACDGTTSSSYGTANTPSGFTFSEGSAGARELREGKTVMLYGNQGQVYVDEAGNNVSNGQGGLPYCGARVLDSGELQVDWRFCTDQHKQGCADQSPGSEWTGTPDNPLTSEQKLQISNVLINAVFATKRDRAITQLQVWCISDQWAEGSVNSDALQYFNYNDFQGSASAADPEARKLSEAEARCNYLPDLAQNPTMTLTGPSEQLPAGTPAQFTLSTNVTTPITLSSTGTSALQLCPAEQAGVTFDGSALELSAPGTATLCAYSTTSGTVAVTAETGYLPQEAELTLLWNGNRGCQVFADYVEGSKIRLTQTANASFLGSGTFTVTKEFAGITPAPGDLDDASVELSYQVTGGPSLPASAPSDGRLILNEANGFSATGPTYPDGTTLRIEETAITGLPASLQQEGVTWTVDGQVTSGSGVDIAVGDGSAVAITLTNTLAAVLGTFEVRKSFAFDNGSTAPPAGTEVEIRWWVQGSDYSTYETITLTDANGFMATPGPDSSSPSLFPLGTTILLEEVPQALPPGVSNVIDWGSNADPAYDGPGNRGIVTIAEAWNPADHTPGGDTSAAEVQLTNGIAIDRGSLTIRKSLSGPDGGAQQPEVGDGPFDDLEILVSVSWEHPDPQMNVNGSNVLLLNASNGWTSGLGVDLPEGTVVTSEEITINSADPSISWVGPPLWTCSNCTPPVENAPGVTHSVTITGETAGQPIEDLAIVLTNTYRVMTGSFSVEKIVAGDIARDDERLAGIDFTASWESTDPEQPTGQLLLSAPDWTAIPVDSAGAPATFPLGTEITLSEIALPVIAGVEWGDDVMWSIGDDETGASFTIMDEDAGDGPSAAVTLTNFAQLHEGTFSIAKFVHSIAPVDAGDASFDVTYRSPGENPAYSGTLTVANGGEVSSEAFPAGTELLLDEILPGSLPGTNGWEAPQFVNGAGDVLEAPVLITIGDGTDIRVELVNTIIEPDKPRPTIPGLPRTGSDFSTPIWIAAAVSLLLLGGAVIAVSRRRTVPVQGDAPKPGPHND